MITELVDPDTVVRYLDRRGVISAADGASARELTGGVSNRVWAVESGALRVVVKQSLEKLRVDGDWFASRDRTAVEAAAMGFVSGITPAAVPALLDFDAESLALTMSAAPVGWVEWKQELLSGRVDETIASGLGATLAQWQEPAIAGMLPPEVAKNRSGFDELRIEPYFVAAARARPDVERELRGIVERLRVTADVFVHGDFSPKNVLTGTGGTWVTDFEVAHLGDAMFDVAFFASHLALKSFALPGSAESIVRALRAFLEAYGARRAADATWLSLLLGGLMTARVDGKSRVEYLDAASRPRVVAASTSLLHEPPNRLDGLFSRLDDYRDVSE